MGGATCMEGCCYKKLIKKSGKKEIENNDVKFI